ncbi:hypothetical protein AHF37_11231 [Paragonimus kellicotti]|nr:hypothetical protein AHF37_11231 [Paragonimus kellicotti]
MSVGGHGVRNRLADAAKCNRSILLQKTVNLLASRVLEASPHPPFPHPMLRLTTHTQVPLPTLLKYYTTIRRLETPSSTSNK